MCSVGSTNNGISASNRRCPGIGADFLVRNDLFNLDDSPIGCTIEKQIEPTRTTEVLNISVGISSRSVQERDIRFDRWYGDEGLSAYGITKDSQVRIHLRKGGADTATPRQKR